MELFWEQVAKCAKRDDVPPIIPTTKYYLVNIYRGGMYFLATLSGEVSFCSIAQLCLLSWLVFASWPFYALCRCPRF